MDLVYLWHPLLSGQLIIMLSPKKACHLQPHNGAEFWLYPAVVALIVGILFWIFFKDTEEFKK